MSLELQQTKRMLEELKTENLDGKVAFSASFSTSGGGYVGPFSGTTNQVSLIFRHVFVNVGNAYNPNTGSFLSPTRGVYEFKIYLYTHAHTSYPAAAFLVKNGERIVLAYGKSDNYQVNTANAVTLKMEEGDVVNVRPQSGARFYDNENHHCTFSGQLLFTL
ncbi:complement C1q-like protein 2 isoform X2 [Osmerus eperlanus]|uniref:complement C1q-like protein 2 isoform X2 n=1 Tax=Osmerus eperlanus TaxID=29151 RepID=UPI002E0FD2BF